MWQESEINWNDQEGIVAIGGDLHPERLLDAYRRGIFPWYSDGLPILWWSPDPRAIIPLDGLVVNRRLRRTFRSGRFRCTLNTAFSQVIHGCSERRDDGTWITREMIEAYCQLHVMGHAHSVETWQDGQLVGGIYGIAIGGLFAGESMFHRSSDASKVAMVHLFEHLRQRCFVLFDTQFVTPHTQRMGALEIPRSEYLNRLKEAVQVQVHF